MGKNLSTFAGVFFCAVFLTGCTGGCNAGMMGVAPINAVNYNPLATEAQSTSVGEIKGTVNVPVGYSNKAGILATVQGTSMSAPSDENGNFTIPGVPVGSYTIICSGPGLVPVQSGIIDVMPGQATFMGPIMLQMMGTLGGNGMNGMMGF